MERTLGVVLAGGRGSRLGGRKAAVELGGRPLIAYPLAALREAGLEAIVCVKPGEGLTSHCSLVRHSGAEASGSGIRVLTEPVEPHHPLCGIVAALRAGDGAGERSSPRPIVVAACDMPFVAPALLAFLAELEDPLVVPAVEGRLHPLLARYDPVLLPELEAALAREEPLTRTVERLRPRLLAEDELARFGDPGRLLFNVNDPADLRDAEALL